MATGETPTSRGTLEAISNTVQFFKGLSTELDNVLVDGIANTYQSVANATLPIALGFVTLWVCWYGLKLITKPAICSRLMLIS